MKPLVSIITPTYKHGSTIAQCIQSVMNQTYQNWEQIVVDDGSPDDTRQIVRNYAERDSRIKFLPREHQGIFMLHDLYNQALSVARGSLIAILEGDDYWPSNKLEYQIAIHENPTIIMSHGITKISHDAEIVGEYCHPDLEGLQTTCEYLKLALTKRSCIMPVSVILRRDALDTIGGFWQDKDFPAVDYPTWLRLFQLPGNIFYIDDQCLGYWRQSSNQVTQEFSIQIAEIGLTIALDQWNQYSLQLREKLNISPTEIVQQYSRVINDSYLNMVRQSLVNHDRTNALYYSQKLIRTGNLTRKVQGLLGLISATVGTNLECMFQAHQQFNSILSTERIGVEVGERRDIVDKK